MTPGASVQPVPVRLAPGGSELVDRAVELLAAGPMDAATLVTNVCRLPRSPGGLADHLAVALLAGNDLFARDDRGRWMLRALAPTPLAEQRLEHVAYAVVDLETTGSRPTGGDRITEIGVVRAQGGTIETVFETLVNPQRPIPSVVTNLTNITAAMVRRAPPFRDVCAQFLGAIEGRVFVAHNAGFDWRFTQMEVERATGRVPAGRQLCTVRLARSLLPRLRRRNLDALAAYFGVTIERRHRAGGDALATAKILTYLLSEAQDAGCATIDDLAALRAKRIRGRSKRRALPQPASDDHVA